MLGYIIELVTDQTYADYMEQHIFQPLGMFDTGLYWKSAVIERRARGYERDSDNNLVHGPIPEPSITYSAGGLVSSVEDMARWNNALFRNEFLSADSLEMMLTPYGELPPFGLTGLGTFVSESPEYGVRYANGGGIRGAFTSSTVYYPDGDISVVVLSNFMDFGLTVEVAGKLVELAHSR